LRDSFSFEEVASYGFAFKKDTGDTRETPAIDVCKGLMEDGADLYIYDPKVEERQVRLDLATPKFEWDHPSRSHAPIDETKIKVSKDPILIVHCLATANQRNYDPSNRIRFDI
jgi:UDPglucose 6-dehydrogenase